MSLRCLLVDDSERFLDAARRMLERNGIQVVGTATSGADALKRVEQIHPDVVLLDIFLGADSGFTVAEQLYQRARVLSAGGWELPIILISTHDEDELTELIDKSPAVGFVSKSVLSANAITDLLSGWAR